jgi:hypothetical protein
VLSRGGSLIHLPVLYNVFHGDCITYVVGIASSQRSMSNNEHICVWVCVHSSDDHAETIAGLYLRTMQRAMYRTASWAVHRVIANTLIPHN